MDVLFYESLKWNGFEKKTNSFIYKKMLLTLMSAQGTDFKKDLI